MTDINEIDFKVGLEIHIHINSLTKLFCDCHYPKKTDLENSLICPICTGQPGSKPKLTNKKAFCDVIKLGLIFNSDITKDTFFNRKHYSWPDMPTGFQRTISGSGTIPNAIGGKFLKIGIEEIHLEEDPAAWNPKTGEINYNRSGIPLCEFVTKPDFTNLDNLEFWLKELILICKYNDIINEDYGIKADVNVSIKNSGYKRVEIKNVGSITNIVLAAKSEILRQYNLVKNKKEIKNETRKYDEKQDETIFMRSKENAMDYRFLPEVDLPNLVIDDGFIEKIKNEITLMPQDKREEYSKYDFDSETIEVLVSNYYLTTIFDLAISENLNPKEIGKFLKREIPRILNYNNHTFKNLEEKNIKEEIIKLIEFLGEDKINYLTAKKVLENLYDKNIKVENYIKENNLFQVKDDNLIENLIKEALKENQKALEDYKNGNEKSLNFIIGFVMNKTNRTAKPNIIQEKLKKVLDEIL